VNSTAAVAQPQQFGPAPSRSWLRKKILGLAVVFVALLSITTVAKADYWQYAVTSWGANTSWSYSGQFCRSTLYSQMDFYHVSSNPGAWRTRSEHTFGWGTGQPWCNGVAAKAWIYRTGGSWNQSAWSIAWDYVPATAFIQVIAGGVQIQGEGQYQAYTNGYWSTYFQWGNVMYPPVWY
jgi:hypothetical protein